MTITPPDTLDNGDHWHVVMTSPNQERGVKVLPGETWSEESTWWPGETYTAKAKVYQSRSSSANFVMVGSFTMPSCPEGTKSNDYGTCSRLPTPSQPETNPKYDSRMRSVTDVEALVATCGGTDVVVVSRVLNDGTFYVRVAIFHAGTSNQCRLNNYDLVENSFSCGSDDCDDGSSNPDLHYRDGLVFSH